MSLFIASDHAGVDLKSEIVKAMADVDWKDLGPFNKDSVDYPDFADLVAREVSRNMGQQGILICGSGLGVMIRANRYPGVRAALVYNDEITRLSRQHNDANILCIGSRFATTPEAIRWIRIFLETKFEAGRHSTRVAKIDGPIKDR